MSQRFPVLDIDAMDAEQRAIALRAKNSPKQRYDGSLNAYLQSTSVADPLERLSGYLRFDSVIPKRLRELAVIIVARKFSSAYPWSLHYGMAIEAGLSKTAADSIGRNEVPTSMEQDEAAVYALTVDLLNGRSGEDKHFAVIQEAYGYKGVVELLGLVGYYVIVCMMKNLDRVPPKEGGALLPSIEVAEE